MGPRMAAWAVIAALCVAGLASLARATEASFPIEAVATFDAKGSVAHVIVTAGDDTENVVVDVYGLDGMRAGDDNRVSRHANRLRKGARLAFDVAVHPGPGRSTLVVAAKAHFAHAGVGDVVRSFTYGRENAAQQAEHSRCMRRDPDGVWIRLPDCEETPPAPHADSGPPPVSSTPIMTVDALKALPPAGKTVRVRGYVVDSYVCPPCPDRMQCKPCFTASRITIADTPAPAAANGGAAPPEVAIAAADPRAFRPGVAYWFEIEVADGLADGFVGRLVRSAEADRPGGD